MGPNAKGTTAGDTANLGYTWIGNNAKGNPPSETSILSNGLMGTQWKAGAMGESGMTNDSDRTADTHTQPVVTAGTLESGGLND